MKRRNFLKKTLFVSGSAIAGSAFSNSALATSRRKNILILGGTGYLGPAIVEAALIGDHNVTLFNRGITHPELFPQLEKLRGVRAVDAQQQNLHSLEGSRRWDAVIDVWPHEPTIAASTAALLKDRTEHYLYVSSIGAYSSYAHANMNEDAPTRAFNGNEEDYSPAKAESERRLKVIVGDKLTIVRPTAIDGWGGTGPDTLSWLLRAEAGGRHIGPGDGSDPYQHVDVKDVARFLIMSVERHITGTFNLTGKSITFREFLAGCNEVTDSDTEWIWIPEDFLAKQGIADWDHFIGWRWDPQWRGFAQISSERAFQAGWKPRPFNETVLDFLEYYRTQHPKIIDWRNPQTPWQDPLTPEKEQAVLAAWNSASA
ncbi:MAG: NAD-dependent epimerase/dehydratase family protein [Terracidiphilus sp.]